MPRVPPLYRVADSVFGIEYGDLAKSSAQVLVSSDDSYLTMSGGVSLSLRNAAGSAMVDHARKLIPLTQGEVAVTTAGKLPAKYIFHAITIDIDKNRSPDSRCIRSLVRRSFELAKILHIDSISFPALGTGLGGFPIHEAADTLVRSICDQLIQESPVREVRLLLRPRGGARKDDISIFYERAASLASVAGQGKRLANAVNRLQEAIGEDARPGLKEALADVMTEIKMGVTALEGHPTTVAEIESLQQKSGIEDAGRHAVKLTDSSRQTEQWSNRRVEKRALQTRLDGLATLLNVHYGSLNKLELDRARYGGIGIPVILDNQIEAIAAEIDQVERLMREARGQISALS